MPRYHQQDSWDATTNTPSSNFIYDFDSYRFLVNDRWREVLAHAADGSVVAGSVTDTGCLSPGLAHQGGHSSPI